MKKRTICLSLLFLAGAGLTAYDGIPGGSEIDYRPYLTNQPYLKQIGMSDTLTLLESDVIVAVVDIGMDVSHPCLKGKIIPSDFKGKDSIYPEETAVFGHGTAVASIIAAESPEMIGIAPNVKILPVCFGLPNPEGYEDIASSYFKLTPAKLTEMLKNPEQKQKFVDFGKARNAILHENVANAIRFAADHGAGLINLSLVTFENPAVKEAVEYASTKGAVIIAGSGNSARSPIMFPAKYGETIAVGGVNDKDEWWYTEQKFPGLPNVIKQGANFGEGLDVVAPCTDIYHAVSSGIAAASYMKSGGGTSLSTPMVTGLAAILLSLDPDLSPDEVRSLIIRGCDPISDEHWDEKLGYGRINISKSLELLMETLKK